MRLRPDLVAANVLLNFSWLFVYTFISGEGCVNVQNVPLVTALTAQRNPLEIELRSRL